METGAWEKSAYFSMRIANGRFRISAFISQVSVKSKTWQQCFVDTPCRLPLLSNGKIFNTKTTQLEKAAQ
ncbi:hypothetical protein DSCW_01460 [Desulfosarcina widdelii]|uniref:Uncharacterized protein n=1 Tax=Desulfosarcina widdelii TaxID=947919 RepID=A0A5K7YXH3_9BACT|nr:hypothetical protein DSCW_01460 [Desulfosarcina widdelii]